MTTNENRPGGLLAHLVLGYPDQSASLQIAEGLAAGGAAALELQIPFSDPVADGKAIEQACHTALATGITVQQSLALAADIVHATNLPCYCMSYVTIPFRIGIARFAERLAAAGICGVIIPDLPFDYDEGLGEQCRVHALEHVAVSTLMITAERFAALCALKQHTVYMALRGGITGQRTTLSPTAIERCGLLRSSGKRILAGFGIEHSSQVAYLTPYVDYIVVGSHLVRAISAAQKTGATGADYHRVAQQTVGELLDGIRLNR